MFARLGALEVFAPLIGHDFGFHADFRPVVLDHFRHATRVRVIRTLYRHRPQIDGETVSHTGFFQQFFGLDRIVSVILHRVVIAPHGRWDQVLGRLARPLIHRVDDRLLVDRQGQRLTHFQVIQRFFLDVERQITDVQPRFFHQVDGFVLLHTSDIGRVRERHHLALVFLQLGVTHGSVRRNGED
ncbi:hypothetical protein D3C81_1076250 [compost metagenome]